jgi:hypothetical protein
VEEVEPENGSSFRVLLQPARKVREIIAISQLGNEGVLKQQSNASLRPE